MRRDTFQAIADPTRREILSMIAYRSLNVNSVTEHFDVSRTAIYKHIKILTQCGLIVMKQEGEGALLRSTHGKAERSIGLGRPVPQILGGKA